MRPGKDSGRFGMFVILFRLSVCCRYLLSHIYPRQCHGQHPPEPLGPLFRGLFHHAETLVIDDQIGVPLVAKLDGFHVPLFQATDDRSL